MNDKNTSNDTKYKRLTLNDRKHIETFLDQNLKLKDIADALLKDPRGISYEIKTHRELINRSNKRNVCGLQNECAIRHICNECNGLCKCCSKIYCNDKCSLFDPIPNCKNINRFPYVCNGCKDFKECKLPKMLYRAETAFNEYENNVSEFKKGVKHTALELKELDLKISEAVKNGQSIAVALNVNKLSYAPSTVYRYIDNGLLSVKSINLKRKCRYRKRRKKLRANTINYDYLKGRSYKDFIELLQSDPTMSFWQMDTVEGVKGSNEKAVLTLLNTKCNLQLYFLIDSICKDEVKRIFDYIKEEIGTQLFSEVFNVILTDNGKEFKDPESIEFDEETGEKLISIYFCEARRSDEKGKCEKNHEHFREFIPKGVSMNNYDQKDIDYISKMINNYPRAMFNYNSPYVVAKDFLNEKVLKLNNLEYVSPDKVILKRLVKNK